MRRERKKEPRRLCGREAEGDKWRGEHGHRGIWRGTMGHKTRQCSDEAPTSTAKWYQCRREEEAQRKDDTVRGLQGGGGRVREISLQKNCHCYLHEKGWLCFLCLHIVRTSSDACRNTAHLYTAGYLINPLPSIMHNLWTGRSQEKAWKQDFLFALIKKGFFKICILISNRGLLYAHITQREMSLRYLIKMAFNSKKWAIKSLQTASYLFMLLEMLQVCLNPEELF